MARYGCARCGEQFGSLVSFDAHQDRDYDRQPVIICCHPAGLGLVPDVHGTWQTPEGLASRERTRQMFARSVPGRDRGPQGLPGVLGTPGPETGSQGRAGVL